jgi:hypothetical protein
MGLLSREQLIWAVDLATDAAVYQQEKQGNATESLVALAKEFKKQLEVL